MNVLRYFTLVFITVFVLVILSQVPLLQDMITKSGYSSTEVWSGLGMIALVLYIGLAMVDVEWK